MIGAGSRRSPRPRQPGGAWPAITELAERTAAAGKLLVHRLPIYPAYMRDLGAWPAPEIATQARRLSDAEGFARDDNWAPGTKVAPRSPRSRALCDPRSSASSSALKAARAWMSRRSYGCSPRATPITAALLPRRMSFAARQRRPMRYVVNRNINYTNICSYRCTFCAFSKGKTHEALRGAP